MKFVSIQYPSFYNFLLLNCLFLFAYPAALMAQQAKQQPFHVKYAGLDLYFTFFEGQLRQTYMLPEENSGIRAVIPSKAEGLEVALQCSGANRLDQNPTGGTPGNNLLFKEMIRKTTVDGEEMIIYQEDTLLHLQLESHYQFFTGIPVIRRFTMVENIGNTAVGIEYLSSAMVNNIGMQGTKRPTEKLQVHYAQNGWTSEAQWKNETVQKLGWYYNGGLNIGQVSFTSKGSMSSSSYLPMAAVEDKETGNTWFWQIEHSGPWHWELAGRNGSYLYLGGPDESHHDAWKNLQPGEKYTSVPVTIGCVKGNFETAVAALTRYRRTALLSKRSLNSECSVIFNDYMNCLFGNPTTQNELPLIAAAAKAGSDYFVIDAGWYGELNKGWWDAIGAWQPAVSRFPNGIEEVFDSIRSKGMKPGLWLEIELAGINSPLKSKPNNWFFLQHGKRVIEGGRYFLDFRNPEVVAYCDSVIDRLVLKYGIQYIKRDYNCAAPFGTDLNAESTGQGMLQNVRAYTEWMKSVYKRYPNLVIENCSGGGMRTDYMMLAQHQIQSCSDQEDYRKNPAITVGSMAAVLPEQLAVWSYPVKNSDAAAASFNMVNSMLCRIHLSGKLDSLQPASQKQVNNALTVYREKIRPFISQSVPFFPLGMPSITDTTSAVALGIKNGTKQFIAVWRLAGTSTISLPVSCKKATIIYPSDLGIKAQRVEKNLKFTFPKKYMAAIVEIEQ